VTTECEGLCSTGTTGVLGFGKGLPHKKRQCMKVCLLALLVSVPAASSNQQGVPGLHRAQLRGCCIMAAVLWLLYHVQLCGCCIMCGWHSAGPAGDLAAGSKHPQPHGYCVENLRMLQDEYDVANAPSMEPAHLRARQSRTGARAGLKAIDLTADDRDPAEGRRRAPARKDGGSRSRSPARSPARLPAREEVAAGSPGEGGWRLAKSANLAPHPALLPHAPV